MDLCLPFAMTLFLTTNMYLEKSCINNPNSYVMKPESIFDCCSYFLSEKYWLQVHASILKLKIVVSQSLQKGEECAVLFFSFLQKLHSLGTPLWKYLQHQKSAII